MAVPFLGRLSSSEYVAIFGSFVLVALETIIRVLTLALPNSLLNLCYCASRSCFELFASPAQKRADNRRQTASALVRNASDFVDLCALHGYYAEEHVFQTRDGYLLGLHRLAWRKGEVAGVDNKVNLGPGSLTKDVVYLHHGLMMNSEVWISLTDTERCLPFLLVEQGFDVWLGNNRGNKYSKKCIHHPPTSDQFWNFSIDEFALYDIPDGIQYILDTTLQSSLAYIGFSQGTAQAFATLSIHPKLNDKVNVFLALAPAMSPAGLAAGIVDSLVKASPSLLFLLFGRRAIMASAPMWETVLYPPIFVRVIDVSVRFLFNWRTKNISQSQKLAAYPHLYSYTSTKSVVHWFQIIRNRCLQMYDDDVPPLIQLATASKYTKVPRYPTRNIRTPIVLVYGGNDSLVDIKVMLRELPASTVAVEIPHYEHLDFLWAKDVDKQVYPHVFEALRSTRDSMTRTCALESSCMQSPVAQPPLAQVKHVQNSRDRSAKSTAYCLRSPIAMEQQLEPSLIAQSRRQPCLMGSAFTSPLPQQPIPMPPELEQSETMMMGGSDISDPPSASASFMLEQNQQQPQHHGESQQQPQQQQQQQTFIITELQQQQQSNPQTQDPMRQVAPKHRHITQLPSQNQMLQPALEQLLSQPKELAATIPAAIQSSSDAFFPSSRSDTTHHDYHQHPDPSLLSSSSTTTATTTSSQTLSSHRHSAPPLLGNAGTFSSPLRARRSSTLKFVGLRKAINPGASKAVVGGVTQFEDNAQGVAMVSLSK